MTDFQTMKAIFEKATIPHKAHLRVTQDKDGASIHIETGMAYDMQMTLHFDKQGNLVNWEGWGE